MSEFNSFHYSAGSENPIPDERQDKLTVVSMRFSPYTHRVALVLLAKNIPFRLVNVDHKNKPEWFKNINPLGKVPAVILPNKDVLIESTIICDYLDESFGDQNSKLSPVDPLQKAKDKIALAVFGKVVDSMYTVRRSNPEAENFPQLVQNFLDSFQNVENILMQRGTTYFSGKEKPGMLDYMIWPWLERYPGAIKDRPEIELDPQRYANMLRWRQSMLKDPVVDAYKIPDEIHTLFVQSIKRGKIDFNGLCQKIETLDVISEFEKVK